MLVVGAGPAGVAAALRAADLGAKTTLVTRDEFGGMAANDGPIPVRTLAHAARLLREARQLERYGIAVGALALDYPQLLGRVREVVAEARSHAAYREQIDAAGAVVHERTGAARFVDPHTIETDSGLRLRADKIVICTGGKSRKLAVPGAELTATHSDAWSLRSVPASMLVIGGGATGAQVASIFSGFGTKVQLFQSGPRIIPTEDEDVSAAVAAAFRERGHRRSRKLRRDRVVRSDARRRSNDVREGRPARERRGRARGRRRRLDGRNGRPEPRGRGCRDDRARLRRRRLASAHVGEPHLRGRRRHRPLDAGAAGAQDGFVAATNAVLGPTLTLESDRPAPIGSFTDPEYAQVGLTEAKARAAHDVTVSVARFDAAMRTIIDGRTTGFCKLVVERGSGQILGCHVVGERAVDIAQLAAVAMSARMNVDALARVPLSFPTHAGILGRAAASAARELNRGSAPLPQPELYAS